MPINHHQRLTGEEQGAVFAEYTAVLLLVSLLIAVAVASLGIPLFSLYRYTELIIRLPIP
ncbi:MAG: hypothetical protein JXA30_08235 [Deltaproteobacteria bacterium]|nr:hypothetical protein [Deltaproteobacteria bacterium]